jgi:hypothetical protein
MVKRHRETGIAIDNNCALVVLDDGYRLVTSKDGARAYKIYKQRGRVVTERIEQKTELAPLAGLLHW